MKYKIGYVDEDPQQFVRCERILRDYFDVISYNMPKGLPLSNLMHQIYHSDIDLLMVDYKMTEKGMVTYNGDEVVRNFEEIKPRFPMIILTNYDEQAFSHVDTPNIIRDKSDLDESSLNKFVELINKNIKVYKDYITKRKNTINFLIEKGEKEGLSPADKDALLENQLELKSLDKWAEKEVPYQFLNHKDLDDLSKIRKEAEAYLESLIKKGKK